MRLSETAAPLLDNESGDCVAAVVVVPLDNVDEVPHVNVISLSAPFEVPVPLIVAVVSVIEVAGSVVAEGGSCSVVKLRIMPVSVPLVFVMMVRK